jgi:hypothetical protein
MQRKITDIFSINPSSSKLVNADEGLAAGELSDAEEVIIDPEYSKEAISEADEVTIDDEQLSRSNSPQVIICKWINFTGFIYLSKARGNVGKNHIKSQRADGQNFIKNMKKNIGKNLLKRAQRGWINFFAKHVILI